MDNKVTRGVRFAAFEFDAKAGELRKEGRKVKLQGQPIQILELLLERPGEVITREELQKKLWPSDTFVDFEHSLNAAIKRLRDALNDSATLPRYIETLARRGYRWVGPLPAGGAALNTSGLEGDTASISEQGTAGAKKDGSPRPVGLTRSRVISLTVAVLVLLIAVVAALTGRRGNTTTNRVPDSIAVLPFVSSNQDQSSDYLIDGITEQVINALSQFPHVRVLARTTAFHYKNSDEDPRKIGKDLGVSAVLTGRISQNGQEVLVQADLVSVSDGSELWGEQYKRSAQDLFVVQRDIASDIAGTLRIRLNPAERDQIEKVATINQEAYLLYLKGRYFWNQRTPEGFQKAIEYFTQATERDPTYAAAYSGLADSYALLANYQVLRPEEAHRKALAAATKALECDNSSAEAHSSMASRRGYEGDFAGEVREYQEAIALSPNYAPARHAYSRALMVQQRFDEAMRESQLAIQLDPLSVAITSNLADLYYQTGRYNEAIEQYKKALELNPNLSLLHKLLSRPYFAVGLYPEWLASYERYLILFGDRSDVETAEALSRVGVGHVKEGLQIMIRHAIERYQQGHEQSASIANLYLQYGDKESAYVWLDRAVDEHSPDLASVVFGAFCVSLRREERFRNLLRRTHWPVDLSAK